MPNEQTGDNTSAKTPEINELGPLPARYANRFYIAAGPSLVRFSFGEQVWTSGETAHHTVIVMPRSDAAELRDLLSRMLEPSENEEQVDGADGS